MSALKCIIIFTHIAISVLCCSYLGNAQIKPAQIAANAVLCFNKKLIYTGCDEQYRLNETGDLNVHCEAANHFCYGPCLSETKTLLNCIDNLASGFIFLNKATTQIIRDALDVGCSYTPQRGLFVVGNDLPSGTCDLIGSAPTIRSHYAIALILVCSLLILLHL